VGIIPSFMSALRRARLLRAFALFAMFAFVGDLAADSLANVCELRCGAESSQSPREHEKGPCQCICTTHAQAVIAIDFAMRFEAGQQPESYLPGFDAAIPPRLAVSIDHPPQLV